MSFKPLIRWICDGCPVTIELDGTIFPTGWRWGRPVSWIKGDKMEHRCDKCLAGMSETERKNWNHPGKV